MKVGLYASMFGKDRNSFPDIESFINLALGAAAST